jgi:hypothetical protein
MAKELDSWCIISLDGINVVAKVRHTGREKFKIVEAADGRLPAGSTVDASDILNSAIQR